MRLVEAQTLITPVLDVLTVLFVGLLVFDVVAAFETFAEELTFEFDAAVVGETAGRAPLSSFGLVTTFFARKFSIFASFIAIA